MNDQFNEYAFRTGWLEQTAKRMVEKLELHVKYPPTGRAATARAFEDVVLDLRGSLLRLEETVERRIKAATASSTSDAEPMTSRG